MGKISLHKKYRYRNGHPARILCIDGSDPRYPVVSMNNNGGLLTHTEAGYYSSKHTISDYDLIEYSPYEDFQIDEPVLVRNNPSEQWKRRHFAGINFDGDPLVWASGRTSWTADGLCDTYKECRRPTEEELKD